MQRQRGQEGSLSDDHQRRPPIRGKSPARRGASGGLEVPDTPCADFRLRAKVASAGLGGQAFR